MRERRAIMKRAETVSFEGAAEVEEALRCLSAYDREKILNFTVTAEFENACYQIAIAACVPGDPQSHLSKIQDTFRIQFRRYSGILDASSDVVADALFKEVQSIAWKEVSAYQKIEGNPKKRAYTPEIAASYIAAATRNADLHQLVSELREIDLFCQGLSRQCAQIHGRMRPAQTESGARVPFDDLFVEPHLASEPNRQPRNGVSVGVREMLAQGHRLVILGDPGGGKTTLALKLTLDVARGKGIGSALQTPLRVVLREYATRFRDAQESVEQFLEKQCAALYSTKAPVGAIEYLLLNGRAVVVFDGLDELTDTSLRTQIVDVVEAFAHAYPTTPILVTSRRVGYEMAPLDEDLFVTSYLSPFDQQQQTSYVAKWFGRVRGDGRDSGADMAKRFMEESRHAVDLASNPLMLGLMCALYRGEGYIPRNRPDLYRRCSEFLFDRWDASRNISVMKPFERGIQFAMFSLALSMLRNKGDAAGMTEQELVGFTSDFLLKQQYEDRDTSDAAARAFVEYCRGRAWVLTDVGTKPGGERIYSFTHRTFLEYFSARQLVREVTDARGLYQTLSEHLKNESWDVTSQLAIQFLDERLENAANDFVGLALAEAKESHESAHRNSLVTFCARILEFVALKPAVVREIIAQLRSLEYSSVDVMRSAWSGISLCPSETRAVVSDELLRPAGVIPDDFDQLEWSISMSERPPRHASADVVAFWAENDRVNAAEARETLQRLARSDIRAAVQSVLFGFTSVGDAVGWHGDVLLTFEGHMTHPGNMHRNLIFELGYPRKRWNHSESDRIAGELMDFLIGHPSPWSEGRSWQLMPNAMNTVKNFAACQVMGFILGVESHDDSGTDNRVPAVLKDLASVRYGMDPKVLRKHREGFRDEHFEFFSRWAKREISLIRDPEPEGEG
ncbi:NACHT domain-containing protein [Streptomyces gardneri]|uniref:NACHT domain-containing protein n=1 Tax=Streptomyces gardneri TaxID=66892 RepID=UPI00367AB310